MRTILFFDLPTLTKKNLKDYRNFVKGLKLNGFYMLQESVYVKMSIDQQSLDSMLARIKSILPPAGSVIVFNITEKQFASMEIMLGDFETEVLNTTDRVVIL